MRRMAWRMARAQAETADGHFVALPQRVELVLEAGRRRGRYRCTGLGVQLPRSRDEVDVDVSLEGARHADIEVVGARQILVDVAEGVDRDRFARVGIGDQETRVAELFCPEDLHRGKPGPHPRLL